MRSRAAEEWLSEHLENVRLLRHRAGLNPRTRAEPVLEGLRQEDHVVVARADLASIGSGIHRGADHGGAAREIADLGARDRAGREADTDKQPTGGRIADRLPALAQGGERRAHLD